MSSSPEFRSLLDELQAVVIPRVLRLLPFEVRLLVADSSCCAVLPRSVDTVLIYGNDVHQQQLRGWRFRVAVYRTFPTTFTFFKKNVPSDIMGCASEDWVTPLCKFQHHTLCCAVPFLLPVCKRESPIPLSLTSRAEKCPPPCRKIFGMCGYS